MINDEMRAEALADLDQIRLKSTGLSWYQALSKLQPAEGEIFGFMSCGSRIRRRPRGASRKAWFACPRHERYLNLFRTEWS